MFKPNEREREKERERERVAKLFALSVFCYDEVFFSCLYKHVVLPL